MSELTTYCSDCIKNHTIECTDARKNSWCCPDYVKKMSEHEKHIMRIAEKLEETMDFTSCPTPCGKCTYSSGCASKLYDWMMSFKEVEIDR